MSCYHSSLHFRKWMRTIQKSTSPSEQDRDTPGPIEPANAAVVVLEQTTLSRQGHYLKNLEQRLDVEPADAQGLAHGGQEHDG